MMNAPVKIENGVVGRDGGILIPPSIREAAGLLPGCPVQFVLDEAGQVTLSPREFTAEERSARRRRLGER